MVQMLRHDDYKYPVNTGDKEREKKKQSPFPRPTPCALDSIDDDELEAARELVEREADAGVRKLGANGGEEGQGGEG
jgi:pre-mRNA splicing factor component